MVLWQMAGVAFFAYVILLAVIRPPRWRIAPCAACPGRFVAALGLLRVHLGGSEQPAVLIEWIWPPLMLLVAYWSSGMLVRARRVGWQEAALRWLDDRLGVRAAARRMPRAVAEVLEAAYAGVYLLVLAPSCCTWRFPPSAGSRRVLVGRARDRLRLLRRSALGPDASAARARSRRALERRRSARSTSACSARRASRSTRSRAGTPPRRWPPPARRSPRPSPIVVLMFLAALAVSAGAVLGRYHYLADAVAGWVVALLVWAWMR